MSNELLHNKIKSDAERTEEIRKDLPAYISQKEQTARELTSQHTSPVSQKNKAIPDNETSIGSFPGFCLDIDVDKKDKYKSNFSSPTREIERETRIVNSPEDLGYNNLAEFSNEDKKVHMPEWKISDEMLKKIEAVYGKNSLSYKLITHDTASEIAAERHENTHFTHDARGQTDFQKNPHDTPDMAVEKDYVTEKTAYAVQCLTLANIYKNCKENGIETLQINGNNIPVSNILEVVPNLKETVEKDGFNPSDPKSVSRIVKVASAHWDKQYLEGYSDEQFIDAAKSIAGTDNIVNQINAAKKNKKIMLDMTKQLDIGYNTKIDIPDDCLADIMPKKEITQGVTSKVQDFSPSTEGLLAIDEYLTKKGLTQDEDRDKYIKEQYKKIVNREPDADNQLKELMIAASPKNQQSVYYTDKLQLTNQNGILTISNDNNTTTYPLTPMDGRIDELTQNKTNEQTASAENTPPDTHKSTLTLAQIAALKANQR